MANSLHADPATEAKRTVRGASPMPGDVVTPAPWLLTGQGLVVVLRSRRRVAGRGALGRISALAFVDYESSEVGPYRELLHMPYLTRWSDAIGPTVDHIWVTLHESAISGNANWGLTKTVATIEREPLAGGSERWLAADDGGPLAEVVHTVIGPRLPIAKPASLGRLLQVRAGQTFATPVGVRGLVRASRVEELSIDAARVTDLDDHQVLGAVSISSGTMTFGVPRVGTA